MSAVGRTNVREIRGLQFKDGSTYNGQVLDSSSGSLPYGYGCLTTKEGFSVRGKFKNGKNLGDGVFIAPNNDHFFGSWNENHKRHGKGYSIRASDGTVLVEEYDDGKLVKKLKRRPPAASTLHWLPPLNLPGTLPHHRWSGSVPPGHVGHTCNVTEDGGLVIVFGGEVAASDATTATRLTNELYMLDVASGVWVQPATTGTIPPPLTGHTATLHGRQLIILGGQLGGIEANSNVYVLDIERGVWSNPVVKGLTFLNHTATLIDDEIWVIVQSSVFVLNLSSWEWREVSIDNRRLPRLVPRSFVGHVAVAVGKNILVHGGKWMGLNHGEGKKYERLSSDVRILDTRTLVWSAPECSPPPTPTVSSSSSSSSSSDYSGFIKGRWDTPRCEHSAILVDTKDEQQKLYIIGGFTTVNPNMNIVDTSYLNDVQVLNVSTMSWESVAPLPLSPCPRSLHTAVVVGSGVSKEAWVYGGRNAANDVIQEWIILHLPQPVAAGDKKTTKTNSAAATTPASSSSSASTTATAGVDGSAAGSVGESAVGSGDILSTFTAQYK